MDSNPGVYETLYCETVSLDLKKKLSDFRNARFSENAKIRIVCINIALSLSPNVGEYHFRDEDEDCEIQE